MDVTPLSVNQAWCKLHSDAEEIWTTLASCAGHMDLAQSRNVLGAWSFHLPK